MSNIVPFQQNTIKPRFAVCEHKMIKNGELSSYRFIVLKNASNLVTYFTGLEYFSYPYTGQNPPITVRQKDELVYIAKALNHIFASNHVVRIADITADMVIDFFDCYCNDPLPGSTELMRSQQSLDKCVRSVSSFFCNLASACSSKISVEQLMIYKEFKASKHSHRVIRRYCPRYIPKRPHSRDAKLLRDMPLKAVQRLIELATIHDPMVAFGIMLQVSAGLRPSCVTNMRQNGSPVSSTPCIRVSYRGSGISKIEIDLTHEYVLRSDGVNVGRIKKERTITVFRGFVAELMNAYILHQQLLANTPCEEQYMPMFVGRNGKAMTYNAYASRLKNLVYNYLKCKNCGMSWEATISHRTDGCGCPFDAGKVPIPGKTDLASQYPHVAEEWDYERNGDLKPEQFTSKSHKKVWWKCRNCGMSWMATIYDRTNGNGCPFDAGKVPIPGKTDLASRYPHVAEEWDYERNEDLKPEQFTVKSNKKVWWKCQNCGMSWEATISHRTDGCGCPFDAGKIPIPGKTDLASQYPHVAEEWDYERNGDLKPEQFTSKSNKKVWWKCKNCGMSWKASIHNRAYGKGCPNYRKHK